MNCLDEPILIAVSKPFLPEFGIHHRLESCAWVINVPDVNAMRSFYTIHQNTWSSSSRIVNRHTLKEEMIMEQMWAKNDSNNALCIEMSTRSGDSFVISLYCLFYLLFSVSCI